MLLFWSLGLRSVTTTALNTPWGQIRMDELREQNGSDLDGTAIVKRLHVLLELEQDGLVLLRTRDSNGSNGPPWVV